MSLVFVASFSLCGVSLALNAWSIGKMISSARRRRRNTCLCGHGINAHDDDGKCKMMFRSAATRAYDYPCSCVEFTSAD